MKENNNLNSVGKRIGFIRSILRKTRSYLQKEYNISSSSLKVWEYDKITPTRQSLESLVYAFNNEGIEVTLDWIENGGNKIPALNSQLNIINKKNIKENKNENLSLISSDDQRALIELKKLISLYDDCIYMYLSDESMNPRYAQNSWLVGRKRPLKECIGKDCIIKLIDSENLTFRRILKSKNEDKYTIYVLNPIDGIYDPNIANALIEFAAPVTWVRSLY
jgi:hypothetical protein